MQSAWREVARIEPTGRANARPMTGSVKSGTANHERRFPDFASLNPGYRLQATGGPKDVDGRDEPGHDAFSRSPVSSYSPVNPAFTGSTLPSSSRK
jgi:hypothetical protein